MAAVISGEGTESEDEGVDATGAVRRRRRSMESKGQSVAVRQYTEGTGGEEG